MSSSTRDYSNKDCQMLYANKDSYLYSLRKAGLIFKRKAQPPILINQEQLLESTVIMINLLLLFQKKLVLSIKW